HLAVGTQLLLLGRHGVAIEEEELGAVQADAFSAVRQDIRKLLGELEVGDQGDAVPVGADRRKIAQLPGLRIEGLLLPDGLAEQLVLVGVRVDPDAATGAVYRDGLAGVDVLPRALGADVLWRVGLLSVDVGVASLLPHGADSALKTLAFQQTG